MRYVAKARTLFGSDGRFLKILDCPLQKNWNQLQALDTTDPITHQAKDKKRYCPSCEKCVIDISEFSETQVSALLEVDPNTCVFASFNSKHIDFEGVDTEQWHECCRQEFDVPVVRTARTIVAINAGAADGYWPLLRSVIPSKEISQKLIIHQRDDGSVEATSDFRAGLGIDSLTFWHNPYKSPLPFAAYLIPKDLENGSRVYLSDLIEDFVGETWNQGDSYRCKSAYAVWNGEDLEIEQPEPGGFIG